MRRQIRFLTAGLCLFLAACGPSEAAKRAKQPVENEMEASTESLQEDDAREAEEESRKEASSLAFEIASSEFQNASLEAVRESRELDRASGELDRAFAELGGAFSGGETSEGRDKSSSQEDFGKRKSPDSQTPGGTQRGADMEPPSLEKQDIQTPGAQESGVSMASQVRKVDSPKEFHAIGLRLELPAKEELYQDASYSVIGEKVAQIEFYDKFARSDAIARAGKKEDGDPSGVYYIFDDSKRGNWEAVTKDGGRVYLDVQVTMENSDVPGVLVSWENDGMLYTLWEDSARNNPQSAAKMGMEIARESSRKSE